ncbi:MAG: 16S rRNA (cytosine(1402)-N(4))-methyltransferase RsmH [candidate division NC10 bacterium]|nr:16S rRNA (cytosine(1402)-N(4))-methyltransferase RsmH [candidate division NC10 bacterium]
MTSHQPSAISHQSKNVSSLRSPVSNPVHVPVMVEEVLSLLRPGPEGAYLDCTVGTGGHAEEILKASSPTGRLYGIDVDPKALELAAIRLAPWRERVCLLQEDYRHIPEIAVVHGFPPFDGILFDLGVSSLQLDDAERGFSFKQEAPIDMRMDPRSGLTAAQLVNRLPEDALSRLLWEYGEERWAWRIAQRIGRARSRQPLTTTTELAELVKAAIPQSAWPLHIHPATRTFQALRIAVNQELSGLSQALKEAVKLLRPGGKVCVLAFHSLEDRIVKRTFQALAMRCICPPEAPACTCRGFPEVRILTKKPLRPGPSELSQNPRSRSAKLRAAERLSVV